MDNTFPGTGTRLDMVYKQATLGPGEYQALSEMWGAPERAIFCFREPAGYIVSAASKLIYDTVGYLQELYVRLMNSYWEIGGDVFEYTPELTISDYFSFLDPRDFEGKWTPPFQFEGQQDHENTTSKMYDAYNRVKELDLS